jgi:hypothetical protein
MTDRGRPTIARLAAVSLVAMLLVGACGGAKAAGSKKIGRLSADLLPSTVLDLKVAVENDKLSDDINHERRSYVQAVGLYSLRQGDLLQATLQVSRFTKAARTDDSKFRRTIIGQIAASGREAQAFSMAGHRVYLTPGPQQSVAVWFGRRALYLLTVRREFAQPRALLRQLLAVKA